MIVACLIVLSVKLIVRTRYCSASGFAFLIVSNSAFSLSFLVDLLTLIGFGSRASLSFPKVFSLEVVLAPCYCSSSLLLLVVCVIGSSLLLCVLCSCYCYVWQLLFLNMLLLLFCVVLVLHSCSCYCSCPLLLFFAL